MIVILAEAFSSFTELALASRNNNLKKSKIADMTKCEVFNWLTERV